MQYKEEDVVIDIDQSTFFKYIDDSLEYCSY